MNKVSLTGRIANDIDLRKTQQGKSGLDISLAVQRERKGSDGKYPVDFIRVNAWEQRAEFLANYAHKGTMRLNLWRSWRSRRRKTIPRRQEAERIPESL